MTDIFDQVAQGEQGGQPQTAPTGSPAPQGDIFDQVAAEQQQQQQEQQQPSKPVLSPEEQASQTRQMAVSGLTGMPTPNMSAEDKAQFEKGKAAGAVSVPVVAAGVAAPAAVSATWNLIQPISEAVSDHLLERGAEFAAKNPKLVELAGKLGWKAPTSAIGAFLLAYEHFKK